MRPILPVLCVCVACGPPDPDRRQRPAPEPAGPTFSATGVPPLLGVGDGDLVHDPCAPGDDTALVFGGQGGFHLEVSGEVTGVDSIIGVWVEATRLDTGEVFASNGEVPSYLLLGGYDGTTGWFAGERAFLHDNALVEVCPLDGLAIELCARAFDLNDPYVEAFGCVELVARMTPEDAPMCGG